MRIGEVLKLTAHDLQDRKLTLREPKSGREHEVVFIPQKVADGFNGGVQPRGHRVGCNTGVGGATLCSLRSTSWNTSFLSSSEEDTKQYC
jgi:integrase